MSIENRKQLPWWHKYTLTLNEASEYFGIGYKKLIYIDSTKTYAGRRVILMQDDVYECFKRILANRKPPKVEPNIDGYSGFL